EGRRVGRGSYQRGGRLAHADRWICAHLGRGEFAGRREERLLLVDRLHDAMLAALDLEDELAHERLVVLLAEHLVALREVLTFLHLQTFESLDELHGVLAAAEARFLHAEL